MQQQVPVADIVGGVPSSIGRSLPVRVMRDHQVLPFRIAPECLQICSPEPPDAETARVIAGFTRLEVRFYLMPPTKFRELQDRVLLGVAGSE